MKKVLNFSKLTSFTILLQACVDLTIVPKVIDGSYCDEEAIFDKNEIREIYNPSTLLCE